MSGWVRAFIYKDLCGGVCVQQLLQIRAMNGQDEVGRGKEMEENHRHFL